MAEYDVTRRFQTRGVRQSDASYRLDFQHDVRFGGQASPRRQRRERPTVASVAVVNRETGEEDPLVRDEFDVKAGHTYDFFAIREEVSEVEADLMALGYLQNRIRLERQVEGDKANLTLRVRRGPLVEMRFEGLTPPRKTPGRGSQAVASRCLRQAARRRRRRSAARMADDRRLPAAEGQLHDRRQLARAPPRDVPGRSRPAL